MSILVVLNLGTGNCQRGFSTVLAQLWEEDRPTPMQFKGSLPAIPELEVVYQKWQALYSALYSHLGWRQSISHAEFEIDDTDVTHISQTEFNQLCQKLQKQINQWLNSDSFRSIDRQLRTRLTPNDEIRLTIVTDDATVLRLPWCLWDFLSDYPNAEIALSPPEYARSLKAPVRKSSGKVKILGILGDAEGINITQDQQFLQQFPNTDIRFLIEPNALDLNQQLWQPGWDVLFFAGHSSSQERGVIHVNQQESLTIEQLKYGVKTAITHGLKLAIFNSCDGLGLARDLADLYLPQVIVMREPIPDRVAQEFLKNFLTAFATGKSLYLAVRQAREQLQALETEFPCATWLPVICQNPAEVPPTWEDWCGKPRKLLRLPTRRELQTVLLSSVAIAAGVFGVRWFGGLQSLEIAAFDQLMRSRPAEAPDSRLLIVNVTEEDIQAQGNEPRKGSLSDRTLNLVLDKLEQNHPAAIGLDIYRDYSTTQTELKNRLQTSDRILGVCKRPDSNHDPTGILPPPEIPSARLGFTDFVQDSDRTVRRHLLFMSPKTTSPCSTPYALSVQLAFRYLHSKGIPPTFTPSGDLQFKDVVFQRIQSRTGGYQSIDARGNQVLLNYRGALTPQASSKSTASIAQQVTLTQVLNGQLNPEAVHGRIVLIGVTVPNRGDYWATPYGNDVDKRVPGILIHAQMVSQILSAVLDRRPLLWVWSPAVEFLWIVAWSIVGGMIGWRFHQLRILGLALITTSGTLVGCCLVVLIQGGWIPLVPSVLCLVLAGSTISYTLNSMESRHD